jgi:hypothetical protein
MRKERARKGRNIFMTVVRLIREKRNEKRGKRKEES